MQNYHVMFYGACGGHICFHLILQSGHHFCVYDQPPAHQPDFKCQFQTVKNHNWYKMDPAQWRDHHVYPNNALTYTSHVSNMHKLYLTCAPNENTTPEGEPDTYLASRRDHELYQPCESVLIWTDIHTQAELARYKKSRWFRKNPHGAYFYPGTYSAFVQQWNILYAQYRQPGWPDVCVGDLPALDSTGIANIRSCEPLREFLSIADHEPGWSIWKNSLVTVQFQGHQVERSVGLMSQNRCVPIRLQEIAKTKGRALTQPLGLPWSKQHEQLVDTWLALHPPRLRSMLLDEPN